MDFMKQIWPQIVSSIITASIIAVRVTIWQTATNGGLISFLSGATVSELEQVSGELEELKEQTDRHIRNLVDVRTTHILVRTRGRGPDPSWPDVTYIAPHLPAGPAVYTLGDLACGQEYEAVAAWHEIGTSPPTSDFLYSMDANVTDGETVQVTVRAMQGSSGYAYVDVFVLCRLRTEGP